MKFLKNVKLNYRKQFPVPYNKYSNQDEDDEYNLSIQNFSIYCCHNLWQRQGSGRFLSMQ
jgi:hypothetical protein